MENPSREAKVLEESLKLVMQPDVSSGSSYAELWSSNQYPHPNVDDAIDSTVLGDYLPQLEMPELSATARNEIEKYASREDKGELESQSYPMIIEEEVKIDDSAVSPPAKRFLTDGATTGPSNIVDNSDITSNLSLSSEASTISKESSEAASLTRSLNNTVTNSDLYHREMKRATEEDSSTSEWLNEHFDSLKLAFSEELEKLDNDINSESVETSLGDSDNEFYEHMTIPDTENEGNPSEKERSVESLPIYAGANITVAISMLLIMTYAMRHSLSGEALADLLTLINLHCMSPNHVSKTLYLFRKNFQHLKSPLRFHHYCSNCLIYVPDKKQKMCLNTFCNKDFTKSGSLTFFIEIPIVKQLQDLFDQKWFINALHYRFTWRSTPGVICDVYDGLLYQKHFKSGGLLSDINNLSFVYNTDGVPVFKASNFQLWPLYLAINELPPDKRFKMDNVILAGLWFGNLKPHMLTFLKPFHSTLYELESKGEQFNLPSGEVITTRAFLLLGTCDLPAKAAVCNCIQFNGFYGCFRCKQPGRSVTTAKGGTVHVFPFNMNDPTGPKRTHTETIDFAELASQENQPKQGIKGPTWFSALHIHDIILGTSVDYMHCCLQGVVKSMMNLWFNTSFSKEPFNIADQLEVVDQRLTNIKPPDFITRLPRSIESHRKHWKANEIRSFLLFYGPVILQGLLPKAYYEHFLLLSEAVYILSSTDITKESIEKCEKLLCNFCIKFQILYGERFCTANLHHLLHLPEDVLNLGPLWTHSCFPFENFNGQLLKLIHGTQSIVFQIVTAVSAFKKLPQMAKTLVSGTSSEKFYRKLKSSRTYEKGQEVEDGIFALGIVLNNFPLRKNVFTALCNFLGSIQIVSSVKMFKRVKIKQQIFHSQSYTKPTARNSFTVLYHQEGGPEKKKFGSVEYYFQCQEACTLCSPQNHICNYYNLAVIQPLHILEETLHKDTLSDGTANHITITTCPSANDIEIVNIASIQEKCLYMTLDKLNNNKAYVSRLPNHWECD